MQDLAKSELETGRRVEGQQVKIARGGGRSEPTEAILRRASGPKGTGLVRGASAVQDAVVLAAGGAVALGVRQNRRIRCIAGS
jgi:hypothetical protein